MIEIVLYSAAGFLVAALIALITVPYLIAHATTAAVRKIRDNMPLSTSESLAGKDQLRAEHAVALCKLQMKVDKQSNQISAQNIKLNELNEKNIAVNKISKAGKLALEEVRSKEVDLNDRLRQRDAEYAGLEQRSRRILRENRDLKLALGKGGKVSSSIAKVNATSIDQPTKELTRKTTPKTKAELSVALDQEHAKNVVANKKIESLQEQLLVALNNPSAAGGSHSTNNKDKKTARLPKALLPNVLGGGDAKAGAGSKSLAALQDELLNMAAKMAHITATIEGDDSKITEILETADKTNDESLASRMQALITQATKAPPQKPSKQASTPSKSTARKTTTKKPTLPKAEGFPKAEGLPKTKQTTTKRATKATSKTTASSTRSKKPARSQSTKKEKA